MRARLSFLSIAVVTLLASASARGARITAETLVPDELFPPSAAKTLSYPEGFAIAYYPQPQSHQWKLFEQSTESSQDPMATTPAAIEPATGGGLDATQQELAYTTEVDRLRPTIVTIEFTGSPAEAKRLLDTFLTEKRQVEKLNAAEEGEAKPGDDATKPQDDAAKDDKPYVPPILVFKLTTDTKLSGAVIYGREFDLGRAGGMRRAVAVVAAKGAAFVRVDARKGLADTVYDGDERNLEQRARAVAAYVLSQL